MGISFQFWTNNLKSAASDIADAKHQNERWLAPDAYAWERPAELLCVLLDDMQLELYIEDNRSLLTTEQIESAKALAGAALTFDCGVDGWRDPSDVLSDPAWESLRQCARSFIAAYENSAIVS